MQVTRASETATFRTFPFATHLASSLPCLIVLPTGRKACLLMVAALGGGMHSGEARNLPSDDKQGGAGEKG